MTNSVSRMIADIEHGMHTEFPNKYQPLPAPSAEAILNLDEGTLRRLLAAIVDDDDDDDDNKDMEAILNLDEDTLRRLLGVPKVTIVDEDEDQLD